MHHNSGELNASAKIRVEQVRAIRALYELYNFTPGVIYNILKPTLSKGHLENILKYRKWMGEWSYQSTEEAPKLSELVSVVHGEK